MRIAVVGSGVSGLVAAHLLARRHRVTLFEADSRIGGHVHTVAVPGGPSIDTGFIVFNEPNYPMLNRLFVSLGVASSPTTMSFSVRDERAGAEYSGNSLDSLFAQRGNLFSGDHLRMLADVRRFMKQGSRWASAPPETTVADCVAQGGFSPVFAERFLVPIAAALWSCPSESVKAFPIRFVAGFLDHHKMLQLSGKPVWRVVVGGSDTYVRALLEQTSMDIRLGQPVERVERRQQGVAVSAGTAEEAFDEVVLACHADQALAMLDDPTPDECALLSSFPYQPNDVVLHTDASLLPRSRKAWASWNYRVPRNTTAAATVTYNMNLLQGLDSIETYCVSLNETAQIDPNKILGRYRYDHPVATVAGMHARTHRARLVRHQGVSCAGAYWGYGFHEDGARSGVEVAQAYGEELP